MNKTDIKKIVTRITDFYGENENLGEIIKNYLIDGGLKSIPCYSMGGCSGWCEKVIDSLVFLRVGFMTDNAFRHHGDKKEKVLCVLGYRLGSPVVTMKGYDSDSKVRVIEEFDKLPMSMKIEIFRTCFSKFEYAHNYHHWLTELTEKCEDFDRLEPTFKRCYMADYDNSCHELKFSGEWDESGRPIFEHVDNSERKAHFPERGLLEISSGGIEQWGFDYAFSMDKKLLESICRGGFTKDYTVKK